MENLYFKDAAMKMDSYFGFNNLERVKALIDVTKTYDENDLNLSSYRKDTIATGINLIYNNYKDVKSLNTKELELLSLICSMEASSAYDEGIDYSFDDKIEKFDKDVLKTILSKKLTKKKNVDLAWDIEDVFYAENKSKNEIIKFIKEGKKEDFDRLSVVASKARLDSINFDSEVFGSGNKRI